MLPDAACNKMLCQTALAACSYVACASVLTFHATLGSPYFQALYIRDSLIGLLNTCRMATCRSKLQRDVAKSNSLTPGQIGVVIMNPSYSGVELANSNSAAICVSLSAQKPLG